jgi:hypothetical protein
MGVDKEGVVEQLAGVTPACWVGVWLPRLVSAMAMELVGEYEGIGLGLVTAVDEDLTGDIPRLDTAMEVLVVVVVVVVVVGVEEVVLELDTEELASACLRA